MEDSGYCNRCCCCCRSLDAVGLGENDPLNNAEDVNGNVCLIKRGTISFAQKVWHAQLSGATAVIIYNNGPEILGGDMLNNPAWGPIEIPAIFIESQSLGEEIRIATETETVNVTINRHFTIICGDRDKSSAHFYFNTFWEHIGDEQQINQT